LYLLQFLKLKEAAFLFYVEVMSAIQSFKDSVNREVPQK
jgi:hypothetical protein